MTLLTLQSRITGASIIELAYGIAVKDHDNPYLAIAHQAMVCSAEVVNTVYLVDIFPFRKTHPHSHLTYRLMPSWETPVKHIPSWFPGAKFKRQAKEWNKSVIEMLHAPYKAFKERAVSLFLFFRF